MSPLWTPRAYGEMVEMDVHDVIEVPKDPLRHTGTCVQTCGASGCGFENKLCRPRKSLVPQGECRASIPIFDEKCNFSRRFFTTL